MSFVAQLIIKGFSALMPLLLPRERPSMLPCYKRTSETWKQLPLSKSYCQAQKRQLGASLMDCKFLEQEN